MSYQHKELAAGRWAKMTLCEQLANIGSEVERAMNWKAKGNSEYSTMAAERALELAELTAGSVKGLARLKEITRLRESIADYFFGRNEFNTTVTAMKGYFYSFGIAARRV